MKWWSAPPSTFPYSSDEVTSVFWDRYPNSYSKHILSEDVLERRITNSSIVTKKLIVKEGSSILKRIPRWVSRLTEIRIVPVVEESIYDRATRSLTTYTRNVSHNELFALHERCVYKNTSTDSTHPHHSSIPFVTDVLRSVCISMNCGKMSSIYEQFTLLGFKKSVANTSKGLTEKLEEHYGTRTHGKSEKMKKIRETLIKSTTIIQNAKCEMEEAKLEKFFGVSSWDALVLLCMVEVSKSFERPAPFQISPTPNMTKSFHGLIAVVSLASLLHCAYSAAQHRFYLRLTEQPFVSLPSDVVAQTLISLIALIYACTYVAGEFSPIKSDPNKNRTWDEASACLSFATFAHRGKMLSPEFATLSASGSIPISFFSEKPLTPLAQPKVSPTSNQPSGSRQVEEVRNSEEERDTEDEEDSQGEEHSDEQNEEDSQ
ncbi:hypothetical protein WR25_14578 [Diploscapter pachys]|uniref:PRELI/MSF1 domain-containing protein n=1 Tax=Diploscapter pachys TaxID=2018661 RepID=A0A2A2LQS2_9BILA|nr:hypothetical protein WR25_14578 [Diploscapter pachys]